MKEAGLTFFCMPAPASIFLYLLLKHGLFLNCLLDTLNPFLVFLFLFRTFQERVSNPFLCLRSFFQVPLVGVLVVVDEDGCFCDGGEVFDVF